MESEEIETNVKIKTTLVDKAAVLIAKIDNKVPPRKEVARIAIEFFIKNYKGEQNGNKTV